MMKLKSGSLALLVALWISPIITFCQQKHTVLSCETTAFAAAKPLPKLDYQCPPDLTSDSDDAILKYPERIEAINSLIGELKLLSSPNWWNSNVDDLNVCYVRGKPGALTAEEKEQFTDPEYQVGLLGTRQIRLVLVPDPCYQTSYNGTNVFLLYRDRGKVYVTEVMDGYFSRVANSISLRLLRVNTKPLIEITTTNILSMEPTTSKHYFTIDQATKKAVPTKRPRSRPR